MSDASLWRTARNIYAVGRNYAAHVRELGNPHPQEPVLFAKTLSSLTTAARVVLPRGLGPIHFELELALRIGERVPPGGFHDGRCISHLALALDFTARDLQSRLKTAGLPWHRAKCFRDSCFLGPLNGDFDLSENIRFELRQNGQTRQRGESNLMIYSFERLLGFINETAPLEVGDLILTGTPAGVGPVADGDVLRLICPALKTDATVDIAFEAPD